MAHDCHSNLPTCLLKSWTPEQLDYMHDIDWWRAIISQTEGVEIVDMHVMECTIEAWADWLACDSATIPTRKAIAPLSRLAH